MKTEPYETIKNEIYVFYKDIVIKEASISKKDLFIISMQALAVTSSFIPMLLGPTNPMLLALLGPTYPMWVVIGVLAVQFMFWYNINYVPKQLSETKISGEGKHKKSISIIRDLKELYKLVEGSEVQNKAKLVMPNGSNIQDKELLKAYITTLYLQERQTYLNKKHEVEDVKTSGHLKEEEDFISLYTSLSLDKYSSLTIKINGQSLELKEYIEASQAWKAIVAKHALKKHNHSFTVATAWPKIASMLPKTWQDHKYVAAIENVADALGIAAAFFGNALGCAGSGFMLTALLRSIPGFVPLASIHATVLLSPLLPITLALVLFRCGSLAHYYNSVPAIKQAMKELLYIPVTNTDDSKRSSLKKKMRTVVQAFSYFAAVVMAGAISTINFLTGKFFGWLFMNIAQVGSLSPFTMATLAAPYTALGIALGAFSALVTFIGLVCLFSKYVPGGLVGLFDNACDSIGSFATSIDDIKAGMTFENLKASFTVENLTDKFSKIPEALLYVVSFMAIVLFITVITSSSTMSICYFVGAVIGQEYVKLTAVCGLAMYFNQSLNVGTQLFGIDALNGYCTKVNDCFTRASDFAKAMAPCVFGKVVAQSANTKNDNEFTVFSTSTQN